MKKDGKRNTKQAFAKERCLINIKIDFKARNIMKDKD